MAFSQELEWHDLVYLLFINPLIQHLLLFTLTNYLYTYAEELIQNERPLSWALYWATTGDGLPMEMGEMVLVKEDENEHTGAEWAVWGHKWWHPLIAIILTGYTYDIGQKV